MKYIIMIIAALLIMVGIGALYMQDYYHADTGAAAYLQSDAKVTVSRIDQGWLFDGPGTRSAAVFYPGGKVEETAYAPLMNQLAAGGMDCFLVKMPFRIALMGSDTAEELLSTYNYDNWCMMGHSLGAVAAASFTSEHAKAGQAEGEHAGEISGLVLLAGYPTEAIGEDTKLLSIYGDRDGCLNMDAYQKSKQMWPKDAAEEVIKGGNHAQFGCYGKQKGDGEAAISAADQQQITVNVILQWIQTAEVF